MDAPDIAAITKIVKMVGTEFKAMPDEDISFWIGLQSTGYFAEKIRSGL